MISRFKIPEARTGVLIGKRGAVRRKIEKELDIKIDIGEEISISGKDAINVMTAENVVKAIGRGFSPVKAMKLKKEEMSLYIIPLPKNERTLKRMKSRIIGAEGRAKANIEKLSKTDISVYGRTVAIIGDFEAVDNARQAIENLMSGFSHASVYDMLERKRRMKEAQDL
jgi:ribosomal RNA assembly protein